MKIQKLSLYVSSIVILLLTAGIVEALPNHTSAPSPLMITSVSSGISYQGRLTNPSGSPLEGSYTMRFILYDADIGGTALWDSGDLNITVEKGVFNVQLGVEQDNFNGQALWLSIIVEGEILSPRQEILPAPYALSLRPGADIVGEPADWTESILTVEMTGTWPDARAGGFYAPATGTALVADAEGGSGLVAVSENSYAIQGASTDSYGGFFTSEEGHGIRVDTNSTEHYNHGVYVTSEGGYGVYAQSSGNVGVRGEAGNVTGFAQPLGPVGVVGIGTGRGVFGSSGDGSGVHGTSDTNYGIWGQSATYRGLTGRTDRVDNNYGLYTPDNFFSLNYNLAGAIMQVIQNNGDLALSPGDVVIFSGINRQETVVDSPIVQVRKADTANSTAVAGVVFSRFNIDAVDPDLEFSDDTMSEKMAAMAVTPEGDVLPGEYVLVVVQGPALVQTSAVESDRIQPGDLLSTGSATGVAAKAAMVTMNSMDVAVPGTVFGKALESLDETQALIYVYVTLQ